MEKTQKSLPWRMQRVFFSFHRKEIAKITKIKSHLPLVMSMHSFHRGSCSCLPLNAVLYTSCRLRSSSVRKNDENAVMRHIIQFAIVRFGVSRSNFSKSSKYCGTLTTMICKFDHFCESQRSMLHTNRSTPYLILINTKTSGQ